MKTIGIQHKPEVDEAELERLKKEEEEKAKLKGKNKPEEDEEEEELEEGEEEEESEEEEETAEEKAAREAEEKAAADKKKADEDYKTKFKESQKEAMIWKKKAEDLEAAKAKKIEVTDEYLKEKYSDWEDMTPGEQRAIKMAEEAKQELAEINNKTNEYNNDRKWSDKVDNFIEDDLPDAFPQIKGREEDFKRFATKPTRKGMPLDELAKIFLFDNPPPVKQKRSLFHTPGGVDKKVEKKGMTIEEINTLRSTNNRLYMEKVRKGEIKVDLD